MNEPSTGVAASPDGADRARPPRAAPGPAVPRWARAVVVALSGVLLAGLPSARASPVPPPVPAAAPAAAAPAPVAAQRDVLTRDVFAGVVDPGLGDEPDLWLAWSLEDRAGGRRTGSANAATERTNAESSMKAWIAADRLRVDSAAGRATSPEDRRLIDRAIRASDDDAAERLYRRLGADAVLRDLGQVCGVRVATDRRGYWSYAQISAEDATRILGCVLDAAPTWRDGQVLIDALYGVQPDNRFGIPEALPPGTRVAVKNGWTAHSAEGEWNLNCVAAWDRYTLAVLTRYPIARGQDYGAGVCRDVTAALLAGT